MAQMKETVKIRGNKGEQQVEVLVDTGAEITRIPKSLADMVTTKYTGNSTTLISASGHRTTAKLVIIEVIFPSLSNLKYVGEVAVVESGTVDILLGFDILRSIGATIDTKLKKLIVKDELVEAAKVGLMIVGGVAIGALILKFLFGSEK